jgi:predicted RecA/RadA family phage recombinase
MALTKVTGDFIKAGSITQGHLHSSHGITTSHIAEGDKLFFTNARVDSRIGSLSTSDLSEGTNLYYTDARARAAISGTGSLSYNSTTGVMSFTMPAQNTSNITEGSNLYYTDARADARIALQVGSNLDLSSKSTSDLSEGTNLYYTDARADARVALIVDSAPGTLNTLNELAAALGDDANFSTTVTNSIALKAPLASPSFTGNATFAGNITTTGSSITVDPASGDAILVLQSPTQTLRIDQNSIRTSTNSPISFLTNSTTALVLDTSQNATFSGDITVTGGSNLSTLDLNAGTVWDATTQGTGKGALHLDPNSATDHAGAAITFGASDASNGTNAQAGIYIRSDGSYGTKMYFSTTDSYATGSKTAMNILHNGQVNITRSNLVVNSDVRATVFYDSNDTTYYIDPASTSTSGKFRQYVNIGDSSSYSSNTGTWGARLNVVDNVHAKIDVGQDADSMLSTWYTHTGHSGAYFGMVTGHNLYLTSHNARKWLI